MADLSSASVLIVTDEPPGEGLSIFFPVFNDEQTVRTVTEKALSVAGSLTMDYEVVIIDDGSPDRSGAIADELAKEHDHVCVIHHAVNRGYGAAIRTGIEACRYEWVCFTDGDDEYDLHDLKKLWLLRDHYDLIITFRYVRRYSNVRIVISQVYNRLLRRLFYQRFRDISTGLRLVREDVINKIELTADSPFIGAEIAIKTTLKGYRVGEVGIQTFPRQFGSGASTTPKNIWLTIVDVLRCHRRIFSVEYELPIEGERSTWTPPSSKAS
jgi:glycosyltransferase involved in cell wall biosynthesis